MTLSHSGASELSQLMEGTSAGALIPEIVRRGFQELLEAEVSAAIGATRHERCPDERSTHRNGYRRRLLTTQVGDLSLAIPKLRQGSFFPDWLEPRRRVDKALYAVVMEAYIGGISTRKVDALVEALGSDSGISKSEVSRICQGLDEQVKAFLGRPLDHAHFPYVYLDATYLHGRLGHNMQVVSRAVVVAIGINALGYREVLGNSFSSRSLRQRRRLRLRRGRQRGRDFLASVYGKPQGAWPHWHPAGDLGRPPGAEGGDQADVPGLLLAEVPGALPAQPAEPRAQSRPGHGGGGNESSVCDPEA
jgi:transposase-like protein